MHESELCPDVFNIISKYDEPIPTSSEHNATPPTALSRNVLAHFEHEAAVASIAEQVKFFHTRNIKYRISHGSTNSTRPMHQDRVVDISALSKVLKVDRLSSTAIVEPNVPMDKLVRATLEEGLIPPVVMEFPGITVGGRYAGSAGESSSFKYEYFDQTVKEVEIVLATGAIVKTSPTERKDLFKGAAGAMGTLGITTMLHLNLIPAKRYVELKYQRFSSIQETIAALQEATHDSSNDYVDGIVYSEAHGVLMTGRLTDDLPSDRVAQTFSRPRDPWFYLHVQSKPFSEGGSYEHVPIAEYLFRYDRGGFWVGAEAFKYFGFVPFNKFTRWFLDDFMHTRMMFRALHGSNMSFTQMIQDVSLPYDTVGDFIDYTSKNLNIWPLWLCPLREIEPPTFHPTSTDPVRGVPRPMLNTGLWGAASSNVEIFVKQNLDLETRLTELGGRKVLCSHTYYTKEQFWKLYNESWYQALRTKYAATGLPTVYDKAHVDILKQRTLQSSTLKRHVASTWPFAGFVGIWHAIKSRDHLIHQNLAWMRWRLGKGKGD